MAVIRAQDSEQFPLYGQLTDSDGGTLTIQGTPTFWMYSAAGTAGPGTAVFSGTPTTGNSGTAVGTVDVWYNLAMTGLAGDYVYWFQGSVLASDAIVRKESPRGQLEVWRAGT